ncbi:MAG: phosphotransferase family protein [Vulcanimicrobiaceae bacterium]
MTSNPEWAVRLQHFIARELQLEGDLRLERVLGGQSNPTWYVDIGTRRFVLRMQPPGELLPSAHALDRESRVIRALEGTGVAVPHVLCYSEDRSVVGTTFYLMDRIDGRIFHRALLEGVDANERRAMYRAAAEMLARLHRVDWEAVGLADYGKHGEYFTRQLRRWTRQWEASRTRPVPELDRLIAWFPDHLPPQEETTICHGDYRFGNLIFAPAAATVAGVLDWELSTLGDPLADLGYLFMLYYVSSAQGGVADTDITALGIPSKDELLADYNRAAGRARTLLPFHIAFAFFRFAVIFAGIEDRARRGNAADPNAAAYSANRADGLAQMACKILEI